MASITVDADTVTVEYYDDSFTKKAFVDRRYLNRVHNPWVKKNSFLKTHEPYLKFIPGVFQKLLLTQKR